MEFGQILEFVRDFSRFLVQKGLWGKVDMQFGFWVESEGNIPKGVEIIGSPEIKKEADGIVFTWRSLSADMFLKALKYYNDHGVEITNIACEYRGWDFNFYKEGPWKICEPDVEEGDEVIAELNNAYRKLYKKYLG